MIGDMTAIMIKPTTNAISTISIGSRMVVMRLLACCASYSIESAMESSMESKSSGLLANCNAAAQLALDSRLTVSRAADRLTPERTCTSTSSNCETM